MDSNLTKNLACPVRKGSLSWGAEASELLCPACGLAFSVTKGIPDMIVHDARKMTEEELESLRLKQKAAESSAARG